MTKLLLATMLTIGHGLHGGLQQGHVAGPGLAEPGQSCGQTGSPDGSEE